MERWVIRKGWHTSLSNIWMRLLPKTGARSITYNFMFEKDSWFPAKDPDDFDINKLCGFSFGYHHKNSVRVGWTPMFSTPGNFTLYFYIYNNGERIYKTFANVKPGTEYDLTIYFDDDKVFFEMKSEKSPDITSTSEKFVLPGFRLGYYLWPYFGGNKTAPKRISMFLGIKRENVDFLTNSLLLQV